MDKDKQVKLMYGSVLQLLHSAPYNGAGEDVQIAKGRYELPSTLRGAWRKLRRELNSKNIKQWQIKHTQ